jgi:hypothetical protein
LTGPTPTDTPPQSGRITIGDKTQQTKSVSCSQNEWDLTVQATGKPGRARAALQLGGDVPVVRTVSIEDIDGLYGVSGGDVSKAEASVKGSTYKITGTAVASDRAKPGQTQTLPFEIVIPC